MCTSPPSSPPSVSEARGRRLLHRPEAVFGVGAAAVSVAAGAASRVGDGARVVPVRLQAVADGRARRDARTTARLRRALVESELDATKATCWRVGKAVEQALSESRMAEERAAVEGLVADAVTEAEAAAEAVDAELAVATEALRRAQVGDANDDKDAGVDSLAAHTAAKLVLLEKRTALARYESEVGVARDALAMAEASAQAHVDAAKKKRDAAAVALGVVHSKISALAISKNADLAGTQRILDTIAQAEQRQEGILRELVGIREQLDAVNILSAENSASAPIAATLRAKSITAAPFPDKKLGKVRDDIKYMRAWLRDRDVEKKQVEMLSALLDGRSQEVVEMQQRLAAAEALVVSQEIHLDDNDDDDEPEPQAVARSRQGSDLIHTQLVTDGNPVSADVMDLKRSLHHTVATSTSRSRNVDDDYGSFGVVDEGLANVEGVVAEELSQQVSMKSEFVGNDVPSASSPGQQKKKVTRAKADAAKGDAVLKVIRKTLQTETEKNKNNSVAEAVTADNDWWRDDEMEERSLYGETSQDVDEWLRARATVDVDEARRSAEFVKQLALADQQMNIAVEAAPTKETSNPLSEVDIYPATKMDGPLVADTRQPEEAISGLSTTEEQGPAPATLEPRGRGRGRPSGSMNKKKTITTQS
jgi:hypothetical protein